MKRRQAKSSQLIDMQLTPLRRLCVEWAYLVYRRRHRSRWCLRQLALKRYRFVLAQRLALSRNPHYSFWKVIGYYRAKVPTLGQLYTQELLTVKYEDMIETQALKEDLLFSRMLDHALPANLAEHY